MTKVPREGVARPPARAAGQFRGLGFGGFVDGIALHQVLGVHRLRDGRGRHPVGRGPRP